MHKFTKSIIIGITALGLGGTALAQIAPPDGAGKTGVMQGKAGHQDSYAQRGERIKEYIAKRQADLHAKLKLSPAQEPAWKAYTDSMTPPAMQDRPGQDRKALQAMPAPQRMEAMLGRMQQRQVRMESHLAALKTFYAALTPQQKKTFDAEFGQRRGHHRGHHRDGMWK